MSITRSTWSTTTPVYDKAFAIALGSTVVVDTLERARKLIGKYRMVTLDGETAGAERGDDRRVGEKARKGLWRGSR